jgi:hypothetical protein
MSTRCLYCNKDIAFSEDYLSRSGKHIPLNIDLAGVITGNHNCPARQQQYSIWKQKNRKYRKCNKCGDNIYWDELQKTDKGKWIPIDAETAAPHLCVRR